MPPKGSNARPRAKAAGEPYALSSTQGRQRQRPLEAGKVLKSTILGSTEPDATRVEIAVIYLEGDAIQWFNWFEHNHGGLSWQRFKEGLLTRFRPTDFDNIDR
ncbi:hypothetical protein GW17_00015764 [Ensete ventricosum]|nr:hypothetical protein GW17_00015764 [Ensete ventricosum]